MCGTVAIAASNGIDDLRGALRTAARGLDVDDIEVLLVRANGNLCELGREDFNVETREHSSVETLASQTPALTGWLTGLPDFTETHIDDVLADSEEQDRLRRQGYASSLITPLSGPQGPVGVLRLRHRARRRWSLQDLWNTRVLAAHVVAALGRMAGAPNMAHV
jgi:hypothetical protein